MHLYGRTAVLAAGTLICAAALAGCASSNSATGRPRPVPAPRPGQPERPGR